MGSILITGATVVTMDADRRVLEATELAIVDDKIAAIGPDARAVAGEAAEMIDGTGMLAMPGLIDAHAHAGHGLVKTLGGGDGEVWFKACGQIYTTGSDEEFWGAEALLSALERIKCGVTTGVSYLGGGDSVMRSDDPTYADHHCRSVERAGTRSVLAIGPCRPPFPWTFARWEGATRQDLSIDFERQMQTVETVIDRWHGGANGRVAVSVVYPVHHASRPLPEGLDEATLREHANETRALGRRKGVLFTQDGHRSGSIEWAHDHLENFLGPDAYLSHCVDLTDREVEICQETDTRIVHNPSAVASIRGRCPVPELLDLGVTVAMGSDGTAPDRSFDMFRHMQQCMHYHRRHFRDDQIMPPGKVLEMATIDAAKALGKAEEIGSIEVGKSADVILLDMRKPHLWPPNMPVDRAIYFANGADVDTTIVAGQILMRGRQVKSLDEAEVLDRAAAAETQMLERTGLSDRMVSRPGFWGQSRFD